MDDSSLWITSVYYMWGLSDICTDISYRLARVGVPDGIMDVDSQEIHIIKEGLYIIKERYFHNPYYQIAIGLSSILENKIRVINIINQNQSYKEIIVNRMENFISRMKSGENGIDIDKEKNEIKEMVQNAKNLGATKKNMTEIGKKMKEVYFAMSDYIDVQFEKAQKLGVMCEV